MLTLNLPPLSNPGEADSFRRAAPPRPRPGPDAFEIQRDSAETRWPVESDPHPRKYEAMVRGSKS